MTSDRNKPQPTIDILHTTYYAHLACCTTQMKVFGTDVGRFLEDSLILTKGHAYFRTSHSSNHSFIHSFIQRLVLYDNDYRLVFNYLYHFDRCSSVLTCVHLSSPLFICVHLSSSLFICVHLCSPVLCVRLE